MNIFVNNLICCAGGKAEHTVIQRLGRGMRLKSDKEHLLYFDFYFENNEYLEKHSRIRVKTLQDQGHKVEIKDFDL